MGFSQAELKRHTVTLEAFMRKRRPPEHIRDELDIAYRINGQSVEIIEIRAAWDDSGEKTEMGVAKLTYIRSRKIWKVYWLRASGKWFRYDTETVIRSLRACLEIVDHDEYGCFWG